MGRTSGGSGGGAVSSVFARTGAVVAETGDYTAAEVGALADTTTYAPGTTESQVLGSGTFGTGAAATLVAVTLAAGTWLVVATISLATTTASLDTPTWAITPTANSLVSPYAEVVVDAGAIAGGSEGQVATVVASIVLAAGATVHGTWSAATTTEAKGGGGTALYAVRTA